MASLKYVAVFALIMVMLAYSYAGIISPLKSNVVKRAAEKELNDRHASHASHSHSSHSAPAPEPPVEEPCEENGGDKGMFPHETEPEPEPEPEPSYDKPECDE